MRNKNFWRKLLIASLATGSLIFTPEIYGLPSNAAIVHAEVKEYVGVGESIISDRETIEIGKQGARLQAIRNAQEQAEIFVSSLTEVKNNMVQRDEIVAFTAGIVKISDNVKYEPIPLGDDIGTLKYRATVVVTIDTDDLTAKINQWLARDEIDRLNSVGQNKELLQIIDDLKRRNAELEKLIANANTAQDKAKIQPELSSIEKANRYAQKLEEGNKLFDTGKYEEALKVYTAAIQIDPNNSAAYVRRGNAHRVLIRRNYSTDASNVTRITFNEFKDFEKSVDDFKKAVELNPKDYLAYHFCGWTYSDYADHGVDLMWHIADPNFKLEEYCAEAIKAYTKAIEINPSFAPAYNNRGYVHYRNEEYQQAIDDYNKAIQLNPNGAVHYRNRGDVYKELKQYEQAIRDYTKAIQIDPKYANAYYQRGETYEAMGDKQKAKRDFEKSKKLRNR